MSSQVWLANVLQGHVCLYVWRNVRQRRAGVASARVGWLFLRWYLVGGSRGRCRAVFAGLVWWLAVERLICERTVFGTAEHRFHHWRVNCGSELPMDARVPYAVTTSAVL